LPFARTRIRRLCDCLYVSPQSPVSRFTAPGADRDTVIDLRAIFQQRSPNW
jgi:phenol 2-monooxygenase